MLSLQPHCSHKVEPLDKGFLSPLKTAYSQETNQWMVSNPSCCVTQFQVAELFGATYGRVASIKTAANAFRSIGIYPFDPFMFTEEDFAPAQVTDIPEDIPEIVKMSGEDNEKEVLEINDENANLTATVVCNAEIVDNVAVEVEEDVLQYLCENSSNDVSKVLAGASVKNQDEVDIPDTNDMNISVTPEELYPTPKKKN